MRNEFETMRINSKKFQYDKRNWNLKTEIEKKKLFLGNPIQTKMIL